MDLSIEDGPAESLAFSVAPIMPSATLADPAHPPEGFNVALAALGGKVEADPGQGDAADDGWAVTNLNDGAPFYVEFKKVVGPVCTSCGWRQRRTRLPREILFSFHSGREARVSTVIIDTTTWESLKSVNTTPKHVEVWASPAGATDGFTRVASARLQPRAAEQVIAFAPVSTSHVKLRFLSNHGGRDMQVGEVKIIEAADVASSILHDLPKNLALPALGGAVALFTSQDEEAGGVRQLVDGRADTRGWRSTDGYLPQEFVFAFHRDREALLDHLVLNPETEHPEVTWPRVVDVSVSNDSPFDGFEDLAEVTLTQEPRDQAFPIGRRARFVKLRILENYGGEYTSLGEVQFLEGTAPNYQSILMGADEIIDDPTGTTLGLSGDATEGAMEVEPNDNPLDANAVEFGQSFRGAIEPRSDQDHLNISVAGTERSALTVELRGTPNIRTALTLLDEDATVVKRYDPGHLPSQETVFSWAVKPGEHLLRIAEPPVSQVLIWDTSGSMKGRTDDLQLAVETYLDQITPGERVNLIRFFGAETEVLLPEFTSDPSHLKAAVQGKFFANGGTPLYDAIANGIRLLDGVSGNKAIVVMTDGADSLSQLDYSDFWRLLREKRIRLYTIGLGWELQTYLPQIGSSGERVLEHAARLTKGRYFFVRSSDQLEGVYQQIANELRATSRYSLRLTPSKGPGRLSVTAPGEPMARMAAPPRIEFILDASGSMKRNSGDGSMIEVAKNVMVQVIQGLPDDVDVALRVYGHRIREGRDGDCEDSELLVPFAAIDKTRLLEQVGAIQALGTTPIAYSLQQLTHDFAETTDEKIVILLTDGEEECGGDPAAVVSELTAEGLNVRVNIVGFALGNEAAKGTMKDVAELSGGGFFEASDARTLRTAIEQALGVSYDVLDGAGSRVGGGQVGEEAIILPEGIYTIMVHTAGEPTTIPAVRVARNEFTRIELKKEGQEIGTRVVGP